MPGLSSFMCVVAITICTLIAGRWLSSKQIVRARLCHGLQEESHPPHHWVCDQTFPVPESLRLARSLKSFKLMALGVGKILPTSARKRVAPLWQLKL